MRMVDEYDYTALVDNTVAYENATPVAHSCLPSIDSNTEVVDSYEYVQDSVDQMEDYCEKEIVLDSDDEGCEGNANESVGSGECGHLSGRLSGRRVTSSLRNAGCFRRVNNKVSVHMSLRLEESNAGRICLDNDSRYQDNCGVMDYEVPRSPDQKSIAMSSKELCLESEYLNMARESLAENSVGKRKMPALNSRIISMEKDVKDYCEHEKLSYILSPEHSASEGKALEFVDHFLSISDLGSYEDAETRNTPRIMSPPALTSKGSHSLARRVNSGITAIKPAVFDWDEKQIDEDEYTCLRKSKDSISEFVGDKPQKSHNVNFQEKISRIYSTEKLLGNGLSTNTSDTNSVDLNDNEKIGSNSEACIIYDSLELEEPERVKFTPDALDIGLDTQMAAEAMEALVHAAPPVFGASLVQQGSENHGAVNKTCKSHYFVNPGEAFVGWRKKEKRSKCVKISTVNDKNILCSSEKQFQNQRESVDELSVTEYSVTEKQLDGKHLNCRSPREEDGFRERGILSEFQKDHCFSDSIGCNHGDRRLKETTDNIKPDSPPKRRKMSQINDDVCNIEAKGNCSKLNPESPFQVTANATTRGQNYNQDIAVKNLSTLSMWIFPKRKRTQHFVSHHSFRSSNQCSSLAIGIDAEKRPIVNQEVHKRAETLLVYTRQRQFPSGRKHFVSSLELAPKSPKQIGSPDVGHFCPSVDTSCSMRSDVLPNVDCNTSQVSVGGKRFKQPCKTPLMKELMRLGYAQSLPDFLSKDSRRTRSREKCCILLSQNLDTSILKHQKKIVERLGLSVASCCLDATHFVTDKFVRTRNMLEAIALGKPVVTHLWLEACEQAGHFIDEKNYLLRDEKKEKEIGFSMPVSLTRAKKHPLLKGYKVFVTPNVKPGVDAINCLVKAVHGQAVQSLLSANPKNKMIPDDLLILACEEDYTFCVPFLEKGATIYNSELLLNGIVTQRLEYERHQLFKDFPNNGSS